MSNKMPKKASETTKRTRSRALAPEQQHILEQAMAYCLHHFPMLWTTGGVPKERVQNDGSHCWVIQVYLRYPTGHEGYLGDLLYDGRRFTEATDRQIMRQRAKEIASDSKRIRKWNEQRASTLPATEG